MTVDVLISGAGPAGTLLAYHLAKAGLTVYLCEKEKLPRYKSCGGGVTIKASKQVPFDLSSVIDFPAAGGKVRFRGVPKMKIKTKEPFASLVMRDRFDYFLTQQAVAQGAVLMEECKVTGFDKNTDSIDSHTSRGIIKTRMLVGADGVNSSIAPAAQLMQFRPTGTAIEAEIAVSPEVLEKQGPFGTFDFGALRHGYGWIFPKRDHLSVGVFYANTGKIPNLKAMLREYLQCQPDLKDYTILTQRGHRIPLGGHPQALHRGSILLTGDAANLADPFFGEGIYYALKSANIAADVILSQWDATQLDLVSYTNRVNNEILEELRFAGKIADLMYHIPHLSTNLLSKSVLLQNSLFGLIAGSTTYQEFWHFVTLHGYKILLDMLLHGGK